MFVDRRAAHAKRLAQLLAGVEITVGQQRDER